MNRITQDYYILKILEMETSVLYHYLCLEYNYFYIQTSKKFEAQEGVVGIIS